MYLLYNLEFDIWFFIYIYIIQIASVGHTMPFSCAMVLPVTSAGLGVARLPLRAFPAVAALNVTAEDSNSVLIR